MLPCRRELAARLAGQEGHEFATTPLGIARARLERGLIAQAVEGLFQCTGAFGRATRARPSVEPLPTFACKALDPFAQGSIGKAAGCRDSRDGVAGHDLRLTPFRICRVNHSTTDRCCGSIAVASKSDSNLSVETLQKDSGRLQIGRVKPLAEPAVHVGDEVPGSGTLPLALPQAP